MIFKSVLVSLLRLFFFFKQVILHVFILRKYNFPVFNCWKSFFQINFSEMVNVYLIPYLQSYFHIFSNLNWFFYLCHHFLVLLGFQFQYLSYHYFFFHWMLKFLLQLLLINEIIKFLHWVVHVLNILLISFFILRVLLHFRFLVLL